MSENNFKITKRSVDSALPQDKPYLLWDSDLKGLGLRVFPSGQKTYILRYRAGSGGRGAQQRQLTLGTHGAITPEEARKQAKEQLSHIVQGIDPVLNETKEREQLNVEQLVDSYFMGYALQHLKPSTFKESKRLLDNFFVKKFAKRKINELSRQDIGKLHLELKGTPYQANRVLAYISALFTYASRHGLVEEGFNPCKSIQKYKEKSREVYLDSQELEAFSKAIEKAESEGIICEGKVRKISPHAATALRLLIMTGCRRNEILTLKWEYIDFERSMIFLPDSKTGKKSLPLTPPVIEVLNNTPRLNNNPYVCCGRKEGEPILDIKRVWQDIRDEASLLANGKEVRLHDLRHTFASFAVNGGLSLPVIGALLGHKNTKTTDRYAHLANDPLKQASTSIAQTLTAAMQGKSAEILPFKKLA